MYVFSNITMTPVGLIFCLSIVTKFMYITTSEMTYLQIKSISSKRLDFEPRDVITRSSILKCSVTCRVTSWCASVNLAADRQTCQLLSEEVSDVTSLQSADGWSYVRKYKFFY